MAERPPSRRQESEPARPRQRARTRDYREAPAEPPRRRGRLGKRERPAPRVEEKKFEGKIDVNVAGMNDLLRLDGVGPKVAQAIIDYRRDWGLFENVDELLNVTGIGESLFRRIKDQATAHRDDI